MSPLSWRTTSRGSGPRSCSPSKRSTLRVASLRLTVAGPKLLLAQHLHGEQPVLVYRVPDLDAAEAELARRGVGFSPRFEFPDGIATEVDVPGPQRIAVYQRTRPERAAQLEGRIDF